MGDPLLGITHRVTPEWSVCRAISSCGSVHTFFIQTLGDTSNRNRYYAYVNEKSPLYSVFQSNQFDVTPLPGSELPLLDANSGLIFYEVVTPDGRNSVIDPNNKQSVDDVPCE